VLRAPPFDRVWIKHFTNPQNPLARPHGIEVSIAQV
jgi:hypothetical protein